MPIKSVSTRKETRLLGWSLRVPMVLLIGENDSELVALAFCLQNLPWMRYFCVDLAKFMGRETSDEVINIVIGKDSQTCLEDI